MKNFEVLPPPGYLEELEKRRAQLKSALQAIRKQLQNQVKGELRISKGKYGPQYYYRKEASDKNGTYICKSRLPFIKKLAQQRYNRQCEVPLQKAISQIEKTLHNLASLEGILAGYNLDQVRKQLVETLILENEIYGQKWSSITYKSNPFFTENTIYQTARGEKVRSKSEVIIADTLFKLGIPYRYEYPVKLENYTAFPDFLCLNLRTRKEYLWEHLGKLDDIEYAAKATRKIADYEKANFFPGINMILTMETGQVPLTPQRVKKIINSYLI